MNLVINFQKKRWCFNNNKKALLWRKWGHTLKAFIIIKTPSCLLKISKRTNKKYLCDGNFEMHFNWHVCICEIGILAFDILLVFFYFSSDML